MAGSGPEGTDGHLTNRQIVLLGSAISARDMRAVALGYMDIDKAVLRNIADKNRDDQEGFTQDVLETWKNKSQNSGPEQVKKLASLLFKAADEGSYVDPAKIQRILKVSREQSQSETGGTPISEKELKDLSHKLRHITEKRTKRTNIDMIPWVMNNTVKLEDLYTELTIDELEKKPTGLKTTAVKDYKELFREESMCSASMCVGKRVLGKGDPGSGKTTFLKKVVWDWARDIFKEFSLVFFVSLKLVSTGDSIENIIIQQTPELVGLKVTAQKLEDILETFGSHCLVILDGYDEHISGDNKPNKDIVRLLKGEKFLPCHVLLTSRPHSIAEIEQHFSTVVNIQGFTEKHAREFASRVLDDEDKIDPIMEIQCLNAGEFIKEGKSVFTSPILLLFICVLVNAEEINLAKKEVMLGEIYMRLVGCLYRKYIAGKGKTFKQSEFVQVLGRVGWLAKETLFNVRGVWQRSKVISFVGEDAFDYGLLIGDEDFTVSADETGDIVISFPHRTIQEFLSALCSILMLNSGKSLPAMFFTSIPLVLHFCLWFLGKNCSEECFLIENKDEIYRQIETVIMNDINKVNVTAYGIVHLRPALNIGTAQRDELVKPFVKKIWSKCKKVKHLFFDEVDHIGQVTLRQLLLQLSSIQCMTTASAYRFCSEELHIVSTNDALSCTDELLAHCKGLDKPLAVSFVMTESKDLSKYLTTNISSLHIVAQSLMAHCLSGLHNVPHSPHLRNLNLENQRFDEDFALALSNVVGKGNLPNIKVLCLRDCDIRGKLHLLFQSMWPTLTHLDLYDSDLAKSDIQNIKVLLPNLTSLSIYLSAVCLGVESVDFATTEMFPCDNVRYRFPQHTLYDLFESPLPNMTELRMGPMNKEEYKKLISAVNRGHLPQLRELGISMSHHLDKNQMVDMVVKQINKGGMQLDVIRQGITLDWLSPVNAPTLTELTLHSFICSIFHLAMVMQSTVITKLHKLDISHSSGMTGTLSILLLCHKFPSLNSLILSHCGLNSQDLCSLAQARAKGRLPELRHLDISRNDSIKGKLKCLFSCDAQWENLCSLNASNDSRESVWPGHIQKLQPLGELMINESINCLFQPDNRCWKHVQEIYFTCDMNDSNIICSEILDALKKGLLPALNLVVRTKPEDQINASMLRPLLVNLLPNNVIDTVIEHTETFVTSQFHGQCLAKLKEYSNELASGEGSMNLYLTIEKAAETIDLSSFLSLVEDKGLTEAQTKELMDTIRKYLHIYVNEFTSTKDIDQNFAKYGILYLSGTL